MEKGVELPLSPAESALRILEDAWAYYEPAEAAGGIDDAGAEAEAIEYHQAA